MLGFNAQVAHKLNALKGTSLKNQSIFGGNTISDEFFKKRFSEEKPYLDDIKFEFSRDSETLAQYYSIREMMYQSMLQYFEPLNVEDSLDKVSDILTVKHGDACVGGARMTVSPMGKTNKMPMESNGFKLPQVFRNLNLENIVYGEVSRIALLPEYANGEITRKLYTEILNNRRLSIGGEICFFATYPLKARSVRQAMSKLGMKTIKVPLEERPKHFYVSEKITLDLYAIDMTDDAKYAEFLKNPLVAKAEEALEPEFA